MYGVDNISILIIKHWFAVQNLEHMLVNLWCSWSPSYLISLAVISSAPVDLWFFSQWIARTGSSMLVAAFVRRPQFDTPPIRWYPVVQLVKILSPLQYAPRIEKQISLFISTGAIAPCSFRVYKPVTSLRLLFCLWSRFRAKFLHMLAFLGIARYAVFFRSVVSIQPSSDQSF